MKNQAVHDLLMAFREQNGGSCFQDEEFGENPPIEGEFEDVQGNMEQLLGKGEFSDEAADDIEGNKTDGEGPSAGSSEIEIDFRKMLEPKAGSKYKSARMG